MSVSGWLPLVWCEQIKVLRAEGGGGGEGKEGGGGEKRAREGSKSEERGGGGDKSKERGGGGDRSVLWGWVYDAEHEHEHEHEREEEVVGERAVPGTGCYAARGTPGRCNDTRGCGTEMEYGGTKIGYGSTGCRGAGAGEPEVGARALRPAPPPLPPLSERWKQDPWPAHPPRGLVLRCGSVLRAVRCCGTVVCAMVVRYVLSGTEGRYGATRGGGRVVCAVRGDGGRVLLSYRHRSVPRIA
eukprot:1825825-Rhodomonas_salina.1